MSKIEFGSLSTNLPKSSSNLATLSKAFQHCAKVLTSAWAQKTNFQSQSRSPFWRSNSSRRQRWANLQGTLSRKWMGSLLPKFVPWKYSIIWLCITTIAVPWPYFLTELSLFLLPQCQNFRPFWLHKSSLRTSFLPVLHLFRVLRSKTLSTIILLSYPCWKSRQTRPKYSKTSLQAAMTSSLNKWKTFRKVSNLTCFMEIIPNHAPSLT